jgi:hypothetical protein
VSLDFSVTFPSDRTMALGSTQPLLKMSTRNIPGGKGGRCVRLTTSPPLRDECHEIWEPKPPSGPHQACYGTPLPLLAIVFLVATSMFIILHLLDPLCVSGVWQLKGRRCSFIDLVFAGHLLCFHSASDSDLL